MESYKILVAEDDAVTSALIKAMLESEGFETVIKPNGSEALKYFLQSPVGLVISDMHMPDMNGLELVAELQKLEEPPVCIVETQDSSPETIVNVMRAGVYDFIMKPLDKTDLLFKTKRAFNHYKLLKAQRNMENERQERLEKQLDWNIMKERITARSYDRFDRTLFTSLKASLNQGAGLGSLVSLLLLLKGQIKDNGDKHYLVRKDIMEMVFHNATVAEKALSFISEISDMLDQDMELENTDVQDVYEALIETRSEVSRYLSVKSQNIHISDSSYAGKNKMVKVNLMYLKKAFRELMINAMKFSVPKSDIYVFTNCTGEWLYISVMNEPDKNMTGTEAIPKEYEKLLFEPFFRLVKFVYEEYESLDFGLGLTMIEKIVRRNRGRIYISSITDKASTGSKSNIRINFEIQLPLSN